MNVVPNNARMTVITSDSKYSRAVDFLKATSAIFCQRLRWVFLARPKTFQSMPGGSLLCRFLCQALSTSHILAVNHNVYRKELLVVRSFFAGDDIFGVSQMTSLQLFLKLRLEVRQLAFRFSNIFHLRFQEPQHHATGLVNSAIKIDCAENRFQSIHQQGLFHAPAGLFLAPSQLQVDAQTNLFGILHEVRRTYKEALQFRKLSLCETWVSSEEVVADQKSQDRVTEELELFVVSLSRASLVRM